MRGLGRFRESERLTAKNRSEAEERFVHFINTSLALVTRASSFRAGKQLLGERWYLTLTPQDCVPLPCDGASPIYLWANVEFEYESDRRPDRAGRKAATRSYIYSLRVGSSQDDEFLAFHWHPDDGRTEPHVHAHGETTELGEMKKWHIPTSRIFLEDVLLFAVRDLGVRCREGGVDALADRCALAHKWATWGSGTKVATDAD